MMDEKRLAAITFRLDELDELGAICSEDWTELKLLAFELRDAYISTFVMEEYDGHPH